MAEEEALAPEEEAFIATEIEPYIRLKYPPEYQARVRDAVRNIVICKYVDYETVKRVVELQWQIAGEKYPVLDLAELKVNPKGEFYIDPMILNPATRIDALSYNVEVAGYTSLQPDGFVVATKDYLMSRTYMAGS